ncbi:DMT family transporter [Neptunicoccus cionae]|uniref:DMT family transporter n=1 Tax=Neptunicoccus cionae TaxID=2035344 RepID=UPI000C770037|nr:DMT family transporter [Amylibacter cionae]PLS23408.1 EamA family transporter [Amylibacter cionae]
MSAVLWDERAEQEKFEMMDRHYTFGVALVTVSALIWASAGIFTRGVDADAWSVIFWRGLAATGFTLGYLVLRRGLRAEWRRMQAPAWVATLLMASGTAAFIPAFKLSSVANVALIWATAPFVTAGLAWVLLRERPSQRVVFASLATAAGVGIMAWGSLQRGGLVGDFLAFWMTLMMSASFLIYRRWPETPAALPAALSAALLVPVAYVFTDPAEVIVSERWILVAFGAVFAAASVLMLEGARRIPAAEVALIGALETPLAPVLAFLILSETPPAASLTGGVLIFAAVVWAQINGMRRNARRV